MMQKSKTANCSERKVEEKFKELVRAKGGWAIKLLPFNLNGLPDRIALLPGGRLFFAEIKKPGEVARPLQLAVHRRLIKLGFEVYIIDHVDQIKKILC
jgi:hypothetical protein